MLKASNQSSASCIGNEKDTELRHICRRHFSFPLVRDKTIITIIHHLAIILNADLILEVKEWLNCPAGCPSGADVLKGNLPELHCELPADRELTTLNTIRERAPSLT